jgi:GR25 family glycosyltransferase involved in LPS biosynthesis
MPIYCINLKSREDRKKHSLQQFRTLGISPEQVIYPPFIKDVRGGSYGCFDSHVKIWHDFYLYFPNESYALIFEDDFIASPEGMSMIKKAEQFISKNEEEVDMLHLHNLCLPVPDKLNNPTFTKGYGLGNHAYFITRGYIQSILNKYGKFPEVNGRHIDYEIAVNIKNKDNMLYTEKIFYTIQEGFKQQIGVSDNNTSIYDKYISSTEISDRCDSINIGKNMLLFLKKYGRLSDIQLKKIACLFYPVIHYS